jgi:hypothetical protein
MEAECTILAGAETLIQRMCVSKNGASFELIMYAKPGSLLEEYESRSCLELIGEGGAVNIDSATQELTKGAWVGVAKIDGEIIGTGAIKRQRPAYATGISEKSNHAFDSNLHELGYVAVKEAQRGKGIAEIIVHHLLFAHQSQKTFIHPSREPIPRPPLFATTSNEAMKIILARQGFAPQGKEWQGVKGDLLGLWIFEPSGAAPV